MRNLSYENDFDLKENDFDLHENESAGEIHLWLQQNWYHVTPLQCLLLIERYLKETPQARAWICSSRTNDSQFKCVS